MNKYLHFIWLPEPTELSDASRTNLAAWKMLNPTWTVTTWGMTSIREYLTTSAPQYLATWLELERHAAKQDDPKPTYGKMSDFARLVICHTLEAEWNVYCDDDMTPMRSMDEWMSDPTWKDQALRSPVPMPTPADRPMDWGGVTTLFTGERVNNRGNKLSLCNNFIMTKPRTQFLEAVIQHCTSQRKQIVLRAFGPWAITDVFYKLNDRIRKLGVAVVPWHYFNWIPKEMGEDPPPPWTVAVHRQSLRWTDSKSSWLSGGAQRMKPVRMQ